MKNIIKNFSIAIVVTICLVACDKEKVVHYTVEGRVIDKITKAPVGEIMVTYYEYDLPNPEDRHRQKSQKMSPPEHDGWSDENGEFNVLDGRLEEYSPSLLYFYDYYGSGYKDTSISIDFSNVPLSGKSSKNYKGDYVLNIRDIELERIE
ncbi:MAG: hypothetical protein FWH36_00685 [Lentimicrobiaceae bacterium]|nr:hypothetical protein [Lentimicrobiaceae bacterium]